jgi:hypothetical protein
VKTEGEVAGKDAGVLAEGGWEEVEENMEEG